MQTHVHALMQTCWSCCQDIAIRSCFDHQLPGQSACRPVLHSLIFLTVLDVAWSCDAAPGDRYPLKLFHGWLFSSQAANGRPLLDWGRVVEGLNKLDAGVPERIALLSRDEATLLAVSYADLRRCLTNSYSELRAASAAPVPSTR